MSALGFPPATAAAIVAIAVAGGLAHGTMGLGFPLIATPLVALLVDVKTAVLVTVVPNIAVNLLSIARGGRWGRSVGRHWPVAACVACGTVMGSRLLVSAPAAPLQLLLAIMLVVYLEQHRLRLLDWSFIARSPRASGIGFGLVAGVLSGAVNVAAPPLIIYFMTLQLDPIAMTQVLNLCFVAGKATQAASLTASHPGAARLLLVSVPLTAIAAVAVLAGMRVQSRMQPRTYGRLLRATLWAMAFLLLAQLLWQLLARAH
ncbi:MAG TPA: sulfite exporter TauE/SafE family protein [Myxococcales bacterium]